jgi:hypothetical protein
MPQQTFNLVPNPLESLNPVGTVTTLRRLPPMTSKQAQKLHRQRSKAPKLSKVEQRRQELAEQERIRKELEQQKAQARARTAREKKKLKEQEAREKRRKLGRPVVECRPSQDTISRFVCGNGNGRKRSAPRSEFQGLETVTEENGGAEEFREEGSKVEKTVITTQQEAMCVLGQKRNEKADSPVSVYVANHRVQSSRRDSSSDDGPAPKIHLTTRPQRSLVSMKQAPRSTVHDSSPESPTNNRWVSFPLMSTQAILESHVDDLFPSMSQQARELEQEDRQNPSMDRSQPMDPAHTEGQPDEESVLLLISSQEWELSSQDLNVGRNSSALCELETAHVDEEVNNNQNLFVPSQGWELSSQDLRELETPLVSPIKPEPSTRRKAAAVSQPMPHSRLDISSAESRANAAGVKVAGGTLECSNPHFGAQGRAQDSPQASRVSSEECCLPAPQRRRFFTSSGTNEMMAVAILRSKRSANREDLARREHARIVPHLQRQRQIPTSRSASHIATAKQRAAKSQIIPNHRDAMLSRRKLQARPISTEPASRPAEPVPELEVPTNKENPNLIGDLDLYDFPSDSELEGL